MLAGKLLKQVPIGASFHPSLTARDEADRAIAKAEQHASGVHAAEGSESRAFPKAGREGGAVAIPSRRRACQRLSWATALLKPAVGRRPASRENIVLEG